MKIFENFLKNIFLEIFWKLFFLKIFEIFSFWNFFFVNFLKIFFENFFWKFFWNFFWKFFNVWIISIHNKTLHLNSQCQSNFTKYFWKNEALEIVTYKWRVQWGCEITLVSKIFLQKRYPQKQICYLPIGPIIWSE